MLGAIAGDVIGSAHEWRPVTDRDFPLFTRESRFTDDTVLTIAVAHAILQAREAGAAREPDYRASILDFARRWPRAGYGARFRDWMHADDPRPYGSWGNGSAMRVSPVGFAFDDEETVLREAARSAAVTHDHPEGVKGAQAVALGVFLARHGSSKDAIRAAIETRFGYDLQRTVESIRPGYRFEVSAAASVPEAIVAFLDADDFEGAVRNAVWLGGDADTQACIAGALAEAFHGGVPEGIAAGALARLADALRSIVDRFRG